MNIKLLKNIMKEVNEPNEYEFFSYDLSHPYYWIYKLDNVRIKTLYEPLTKFRKSTARYDIFINGLFIREADYILEPEGNGLFLKFIRSQFPEFDRFGNPYALIESDEVKITGDVEIIK
jgi:hypothetical protein